MKAKHRLQVFVGDGLRGRGVFARAGFRPQEVIGRIAGEIIRDPDHSSSYCIELDDGMTLEPAAPFRYLNHSCDPNCEIVQIEGRSRRAPRLWLHSLRSVRPRDELTIDYGWPPSHAIPCACGSRNCRGWIVRPEDSPGQ